jgi:sugar/nucleoside kinase (ribokinase family)
LNNIIGGAGTFAALGARVFSPAPTLSKTVTWVVDRGWDFPHYLTDEIKTWNTGAIFRNDRMRCTTRGWNKYHANDIREFKYVTEKLRLDHNIFLDFPHLLTTKSLHLICSPKRCINLIREIDWVRRSAGTGANAKRPFIIWEPVPDLCNPEELIAFTTALGYVDVCSPNHIELGTLMARSPILDNGDVDKECVEEGVEMLLAALPISNVSVLVRCGKDGCYVGQNGGRSKSTKPEKKDTKENTKPKQKKIVGGGFALNAEVDMMALLAGIGGNASESESEEEEKLVDHGTFVWIPAYHTEQTQVLDPTGGGNTFLGSCAIAVARGKTLVEAARYGIVGASFAIEQVGVPNLTHDENGEKWNGVDPFERLKEFETRLGLESLKLT